jgi:hypothetical protein
VFDYFADEDDNLNSFSGHNPKKYDAFVNGNRIVVGATAVSAFSDSFEKYNRIIHHS